jgi:hypothetical protein
MTEARYDVFDGEEVLLAHDLSARRAAEFVGLARGWISDLERHVAEYGSLAADDYTIRRTT